MAGKKYKKPCKIHKKLLIARTELERIKDNRTSTKKRKGTDLCYKRNENQSWQHPLLATWKNKRLKAKYVRKRKQEEARSLNRPKYKSTIWKGGDSETFGNIEEASSFWRALCEEEVSGNEDLDWLDEVKEVFIGVCLPQHRRRGNHKRPKQSKLNLKRETGVYKYLTV